MWRNSLVFHSMDKVVRYVAPNTNNRYTSKRTPS
jgi:hypothetical protein